MHKITLALGALALSAATVTTGALAQATPTPDFATVDADKSGEVSYGELQLVLPDVSQEQFNTADADKSGGLTETELATITAAGTQSLTTDTPTGSDGTDADSTTSD